MTPGSDDIRADRFGLRQAVELERLVGILLARSVIVVIVEVGYDNPGSRVGQAAIGRSGDRQCLNLKSTDDFI